MRWLARQTKSTGVTDDLNDENLDGEGPGGLLNVRRLDRGYTQAAGRLTESTS